ncbi:MAG: nitrate ABC transporter substrate-binding protein [Oceanospirillaceae bacterium]|uniref:ABC transporter substrate-binding protein n=1 Tax=unclassified Thalassolituus TaxID=2624967 RepID=UPI000C6804FE|nr:MULTISPECIES: ABC transporter substrate-binding protein [unclassified Thalassolituus]MBL34122.1 nitrate ABC transporter substrate-binding protein [Oceanospirillaceae bacterium]MBS55198.1 nitrate ABC transporter substrate-binding protein [Oceanospirillaceae bacterium]|tara:strand:+ start:513 stop:1499 length:987 start_codon:yes stop_codon:yes gene_type:complete
MFRLLSAAFRFCTLGAWSAAIFTAMTAGAQANEKIVFATNWYAQAEHGGFYQAIAEGIYAQHGLDVEIRMGGPQVNGMQLLAAGQVDFLMGVPISTVHAVAEGIPVVAVAATFQKDPAVVIAHSHITSLADVGVHQLTFYMSPSANTSYFPWLKSEFGFTDNMAKPYNFSVTPFLVNKQSAQQGLVTSEPFAIQKAGVTPSVFLMADYGYPPYAETIETTRSMIDNHPDLVRRFVKASMLGWQSYLNDPAAANALIKRDNPEMTDEQLAFGIATLKQYGIVTGGDAQQHGPGVMTGERWQALYDFMHKGGLLNKAVDIQQVYSLDFLP